MIAFCTGWYLGAQSMRFSSAAQSWRERMADAPAGAASAYERPKSLSAPCRSLARRAIGPALRSLTSMNDSATCSSAPASPPVSQMRYCANRAAGTAYGPANHSLRS